MAPGADAEQTESLAAPPSHARSRATAATLFLATMALAWLHVTLMWIALAGVASGASSLWPRRRLAVLAVLVYPFWCAEFPSMSATALRYLPPLETAEGFMSAYITLVAGLLAPLFLVVAAAWRATGFRRAIIAGIVAALLGAGALDSLLTQGIELSDRDNAVKRNLALGYLLGLHAQGVVSIRADFHYTATATLKSCDDTPILTERLAFDEKALAALRAFVKDVPPASGDPARVLLERRFAGAHRHLQPNATVSQVGAEIHVLQTDAQRPDRTRFPGVRRWLGASEYASFEFASLIQKGLLLVPEAGSVLLIDAPTGCIAQTAPRHLEVTRVNGRDVFVVPVGFPRGVLSPFPDARLFADPFTVVIDLLRPSARAYMVQRVLGMLLTLPGQLAFGTAAYLLGVRVRALLGGQRAADV